MVSRSGCGQLHVKGESKMTITLQSGQFGWDYLIVAANGRTIYFQSADDYPGLASSFGWTADSGQTPQEWLDSHVGESIEDPGYFAAVVP